MFSLERGVQLPKTFEEVESERSNNPPLVGEEMLQPAKGGLLLPLG